ncbi:unnamed protein product [Effrenium voratum]|nr:unnamed protein product [Effrenium voratum]
MPYLKLIAGNEVLYNEDLTLFEYDITTNSIIRVGIGLLGGAPAKKRKPTLSAMKPAEDDDLRVKACFGLTHFNETAWVESLSQKVRQEYLEVLEKNRNYTSQIDATVSRIREFSILKEVADSLNQRLIDAEYYLKDLVETSLNNYQKGEWLGVVRATAKKSSNGGNDMND